jgi:salicylate hydroxylase
MPNEIIIVGAGIGGLTLALALEQRGIGFQLYEQANSFEALGYGIQVSPNVVRVLEELGVAKQLAQVAHLCQGFELRSFNSDRVIAKWQLNSAIPYYQCRRADLHQLLFSAVENKNRIHFSQRLASYEDRDNQLCLNFSNQDSIAATALVAADGVHSRVRQLLFPQHRARYAGYAAFRAILPFKAKYDSLFAKATVWMGKNHHVVAYPNGNQQTGKCWLNLVLVVKERDWTEEGWTILADKREIAQNFANNSVLLKELLNDLVASPEPCYQWGLFVHEPLPYWSQGKITLLGDAAHPMLPFQAQGAAMAIEDAYVLAKYLASEQDATTAFVKYQQARIQRTTKVQQVSKNNADIFHASGTKATMRNLALGLVSAIAPSLINLKTAWIYDYNLI